MSTYSTTARAVAAGNPASGVVAAVAHMVRKMRREIEIRRAVRALSGMPDHMLDDLGIRRDQIDLAARFGREHGRRYL